MRSALSVPQCQTTARASGETQCNPRREDGSEQQQRNDGIAHARDREASAISSHLRSITGRCLWGDFDFWKPASLHPYPANQASTSSRKRPVERKFPTVYNCSRTRVPELHLCAGFATRSPREVSTMQIGRWYVPESTLRTPSTVNLGGNVFLPGLVCCPRAKKK